MCLACVTASVLGGVASSALGVKVPDQEGAYLLSSVLTCNLMVITTVALKQLFNLTICQGNSLNVKTVAILTGFNVLLGMVYSIGVNHLLGRYVYTSAEIPIERACCC